MIALSFIFLFDYFTETEWIKKTEGLLNFSSVVGYVGAMRRAYAMISGKQ